MQRSPLPTIMLGAIRQARKKQLPPARRRDPFTIERYPSLNGSVCLVGYDGKGEIMLELRIPATRFSERMLERMRRWMIRNDEADVEPITLVP